MRTLAAMGCMGLVVVSIAVACSGDEAKKVVGDSGGAAGTGEAGKDAGGVNAGGGHSDPDLGGAGATPVGNGGAAGMSTIAGGVGGVGGTPETTTDAGAAGVAGAGGVPAVDCPAETGKFTHQCADAVSTWAPIWNGTLNRFELELGELPFPLASGTISYFVNYSDGQSCGTVPIQVTATGIVAPVTTTFFPTDARITTFTFLDVCGNTHDYDAVGAPACNDIRGSGNGFGNLTLTCNTRFSGNCPEACPPP